MTIAFPNKNCREIYRVTEEDGDQRILGEEVESEMGTLGLNYNWRKMEAAAQDRTGWGKVVCGLCSTGSDEA